MSPHKETCRRYARPNLPNSVSSMQCWQRSWQVEKQKLWLVSSRSLNLRFRPLGLLKMHALFKGHFWNGLMNGLATAYILCQSLACSLFYASHTEKTMLPCRNFRNSRTCLQCCGNNFSSKLKQHSLERIRSPRKALLCESAREVCHSASARAKLHHVLLVESGTEIEVLFTKALRVKLAAVELSHYPTIVTRRGLGGSPS